VTEGPRRATFAGRAEGKIETGNRAMAGTYVYVISGDHVLPFERLKPLKREYYDAHMDQLPDRH
jgi:hypothetical protein